MSTTQHHGTHTFKAAPAAPASNSVDPNADAISELLDILEAIDDPAVERQAIQAATQAVKQFVQQNTESAPSSSQIVSKTARGASFWDGLFGQVAADHRAGPPPFSNQ